MRKLQLNTYLYTDLILDSGDCQYVDVDYCPEICGQPVQKHQLATHVANNCSRQNFTCMDCELWGWQWETLARVEELPSTMPQQMSDWGCWTQCSKRPLECVQFASSWMWLSAMQATVRSFRGKTWKRKRTEKRTWHRSMASASKKEELLLPYSLPTLI